MKPYERQENEMMSKARNRFLNRHIKKMKSVYKSRMQTGFGKPPKKMRKRFFAYHTNTCFGVK